MKSTAFLTTVSFILYIKTTNGQHNGLVYSEHMDIANSPPQHPYNSFKDFLIQNGNIAPIVNKISEQEMILQTPWSSPCSQQAHLAPDVHQQPLQIQQYLQLQTPLQQIELQAKPGTEYPFHIQSETQSPLSPISQDILQLQPQNQLQPYLHSQRSLQKLQPVQTQQLLQTPQLLNIEQPVNSLQIPQLELQQPLAFQQKLLPENNHIIETPVRHRISNNLPSSQIHVKWKANPQAANVENPRNVQNFNIQTPQNSINQPVDVRNIDITSEIPQRVSSPSYYLLPQTSPPGGSNVAASVLSNPLSIPTIPSNIIPVGQTNNPNMATYNYIMPVSEVQPEITKSLKPISSPPPVLKTLNPPIQNSNYYTQQAADPKQNAYVNLNSGLHYSELPQFPITNLKREPTTIGSHMPAIVSSMPMSVVKIPAVSPQYAVSPSYPVNTIVVPAAYKPKSSNFKSILPLIFNLLKEKIASCSCRNDCSCDCKNEKGDNEVEVISEYSNKRDYGSFNDGLSVLDTVSEETEGPQCVRETKNCETIKNISSEESDEAKEDEDFDEDEETQNEEDGQNEED